MSSAIGSATKPPSALGSLFRIVVFRRLWGAITLSSLGDWLGLLATTALAAYLTRDSSSIVQGTAISGVLVTRLLPDLVFGPVAGSLVDRFDRRAIAISCDLLACVLYVVIAFGHNLTVLLVGQFLVEAVGLFSTPAKQAMWVNIVPRERLAVANQLNYVSIYGMVPVAALIFALLSTVSQFFATTPQEVIHSTGLISGNASSTAITIVLVFNAATFAVTSSVLYFSRRMIPAFVGERSTTRSVFSLIREGISFVKNSSVMRALYLGILGAFGAGGLVAGVAQSYVATLGAGNAGYGILFGSVFTGLALGMLVGPKVLPAVPRRVVFTVCVGLAGAMLLLMSLVPDFVGAVITAAAMGLAAGVAWITGFTMIGHEVSDQLRGRVFAFVMSSVRLTLLAAIAVGPVLAGAIGGHTVTIGAFVFAVSGPGMVLAIGGVVAVVVSLIAGRQVGGMRAGIVSRMLRRRRLLAEHHDRPGVLIAVEGCDRAANAAVADAVIGELASAGWRAMLERGGSWPESSYSSLATALRATAALSDTLQARVEPELSTGGVVVYQDYLDSVVVRFGAQGGLDEERLLRVGTWVTRGAWPDLTILVDPGSAPPAEDRRDPEVPGTLEIVIEDADETAPGDGVDDVPAGGADSDGVPAGGADSGGASDNGVDPEQAFRERAASAPERYLRIPPLTVAQGTSGELPEELRERIASVLRLRTPVRVSARLVARLPNPSSPPADQEAGDRVGGARS